MTDTSQSTRRIDGTPAFDGPLGAADREPRTRGETAGLVLATVATFAVAAWMMRRREVWLDEGFSYTAARLPLADLASWAVNPHGELNMALYYLVLGPFAAVSVAPWWIRLPSVIPTVATVAFVWLIADRLTGRRFVRVAAVLVYLAHPLAIDYAFEARAYGMLFAATAGLTLLLIMALQGSRPARWAYTILLPLLIALHFLVIFVIVSHAVAIVLATPGGWRRRAGRAAALAGPGLAVAAIAALAIFRDQGTLANSSSITAWSFGSAVYAVTGRAGPLTLLVIACVVVAGVTLTRDRHVRPEGLVLVLTAVGPAVLSLAASIHRPIFTPRYLVNLVPILACLVAIGLAAAIADRRRRIVVLGVLVGLGIVGQGFVYWSPSHETPDTASAYVLERTRPGDVVVFNNPYAQMPYQRYLDDVGATGPVQADLLTDPTFPTRTESGAPLEPLVRDLAPGASVWIIENRPIASRTEALRADLATEGGLQRTQRTEFDAVAVEQWTRTP